MTSLRKKPKILESCQPIFLYSGDSKSYIAENIINFFKVGCIYKFVPYTNIYSSDERGVFSGIDLRLDKPADLLFLGTLKLFERPRDVYPNDEETNYAKFLFNTKVIYLEKAELIRSDIYVYSTSDIVTLAEKLFNEST